MNYLVRLTIAAIGVAALYFFSEYMGRDPFNVLAVFACVKIIMMDLDK